MRSEMVGTTRRVGIRETGDGHLIGDDGEHTVLVDGEVDLGGEYPVRIVGERGDRPVAVAVGAELKLRIDETVDGSTSEAAPGFGPVIVSASLTEGDWWRCEITGVHDDRITATPLRKIPRRSSIDTGPLPDDPTQSLNHLLNRRSGSRETDDGPRSE